MSRKTIRVLATVVVLGGAFVTLLGVSLREDAQFYMKVDEVMPKEAEWYGKPLKLHGFVEDGSILKRPNTLDYRFKVKNGESVVLASYSGILPDGFKDGSEVVLTGRLSDAGFQVEENGVSAKCPSKYEAGAQSSNAVPLQGPSY
jgi:cytochrome c-type biogenesis protein CcmE